MHRHFVKIHSPLKQTRKIKSKKYINCICEAVKTGLVYKFKKKKHGQHNFSKMKGIKKLLKKKGSSPKADSENAEVSSNVYVQPTGSRQSSTLTGNPFLEAAATAAAGSHSSPYEELKLPDNDRPAIPARRQRVSEVHYPAVSSQEPHRADSQYQVVVAIDFGTAASGYAYSYTKDPDNVHMNKNWGAELGVGCYKAPTCVSVHASDRRFRGFGFTAQKLYLDDPDEIELYREFKMQLVGQKVARQMVVKNEYRSNRKSTAELPAVQVFSMALSFLKKHYLSVLEDTAKDLSLDEIRWVLTVPALWTDEQKYFMREVATQAGLIRSPSSDQLIIALEPECASLYCRTIKAHLFEGVQGPNGMEAMELPLGSQYMVLDCGGGTIDITVHKVTGPYSSEEVYQPSGLTVGGTNINKNFELLMEQVLGAKFVEFCLHRQPSVWLELIVDFEQKKKEVNSQFESHLDVQVNLGLNEYFTEFTGGQSLKAYFSAEHSNNEKVSFTRGGKFRITAKALRDDIFSPVITTIMSHLKTLFDKPSVQEVETIFIVGGFGQCKCLQEEVRSLFDGQDIRVLIPEEPSLCVLKGAVKFGHRPQYISSRISRWTYALLVSRAYQPGKDEQQRKKVLPGCAPYVEFLSPIVVKGDSLKLNLIREKVVQPRMPDQTEVDLTIYSCSEMTVDSPQGKGVKRLGDITVQVPMSSNIKDREVTVQLIFGGTELKVRGVTASGHTVETRLDLLE